MAACLPLAKLIMYVLQNKSAKQFMVSYDLEYLSFSKYNSVDSSVLACVKVLVCIVETSMCRITLSIRGLGPVRKPILNLENKTTEKSYYRNTM